MSIDALLWVDLETTGSNEKKDCIIEVGAILTDPKLHTLWEFERVVSPKPLGLGRLLQNPVVKEMHERNGLLERILGGFANAAAHVVEQELLYKLNEYQPRTVLLAGSGVGHFDRRFIKAEMGRLDNFLHYACLDVGSIRRLCQFTDVKTVDLPNDRKTHRALDDIRLHVAEARMFADMLKLGEQQ